MLEGDSVTLTCSTDANPAASYTWYKQDATSDPRLLSEEPQLVFSSIQSSDFGNYSCTAENQLGRKTSEFILIDLKSKGGSPGSITTASVASTSAFLLVIMILAAFFLTRKKRSSQSSRPGETPENTQNPPVEPCYATVSFSSNQKDLLYFNIRPARPPRRAEEVEEVQYSSINFNRAGAASERRCEGAVADSSALYSTVSKAPRE